MVHEFKTDSYFCIYYNSLRIKSSILERHPNKSKSGSTRLHIRKWGGAQVNISTFRIRIISLVIFKMCGTATRDSY